MIQNVTIFARLLKKMNTYGSYWSYINAQRTAHPKPKNFTWWMNLHSFKTRPKGYSKYWWLFRSIALDKSTSRTMEAQLLFFCCFFLCTGAQWPQWAFIVLVEAWIVPAPLFWGGEVENNYVYVNISISYRKTFAAFQNFRLALRKAFQKSVTI